MNAKEELIEILLEINEKSGKLAVECARIQLILNSKVANQITLKLNYSNDNYNEFMKNMDFEYSDSKIGDGIDGIVWLNDGSWLERRESGTAWNGFDYWEHCSAPEIPEQCK